MKMRFDLMGYTNVHAKNSRIRVHDGKLLACKMPRCGLAMLGHPGRRRRTRGAAPTACRHQAAAAALPPA